MTKKIAIVGGGPSGLFMYKRIVETSPDNVSVQIFESGKNLGCGMPYSTEGASREHITNVSGNEIPDIIIPLMDWLKTLPKEKLESYQIDLHDFSDYRVLPRLLFGDYLNDQFILLKAQAETLGINTQMHYETRVTDIRDLPEKEKVRIEFGLHGHFEFDIVVICTGHEWPLVHEGKVPGYFDSPYPPSKLRRQFNHPVAIRGSSLTAIDAIRTIARSNGEFIHHDKHRVSYVLGTNSPDFKLIMHSRQGLLPAIRFHLDDPRLKHSTLLTDDQIAEHRKANDGFLSLDFIFEKDFKEAFKEKDPAFYQYIRDMQLEEFVEVMLSKRESEDPFVFFKKEYEEARQSILQHESVYWKEMLAVLSFAMNYPAKYLSAEDMQRLQKVLMPLISIVIAFVPQSSCEELIALHDIGKLELVSVGEDSEVNIDQKRKITYQYQDGHEQSVQQPFETFVDCIGQRHLTIDSFPFKSLVNDGTVSASALKFRSSEAGRGMLREEQGKVFQNPAGEYLMSVPGIAINDSFQVLDQQGEASPRLYLMAVSYLGGYNPDYSGLDFCEEASARIAKNIFNGEPD